MWWFKKKIKIPEAKNIWKLWEHTGWGNTIYISSWELYPKITGWISNPRVSLGDIIVTRMNSGKLCWFKVIELRYCTDPKDMFSGQMKAIGDAYVTEEEVESKVKELAPNRKVSWLI